MTQTMRAVEIDRGANAASSQRNPDTAELAR